VATVPEFERYAGIITNWDLLLVRLLKEFTDDPNEIYFGELVLHQKLFTINWRRMAVLYLIPH